MGSEPRSAVAIGDALGDVAAVGVHQSGEVQHLAEGHGAKVEVESCDENVLALVERAPGKEEKLID